MINHDELKQKLTEEKTRLEAELNDLGVQDKSVPEDWVATPDEPITTEADPNEVADRSEEWTERRGEMSLLETRYNNVLRALRKMEDGTYGVCEVSGAAIEADRLEANPAARTCKAHLDEEANLPL